MSDTTVILPARGLVLTPDGVESFYSPIVPCLRDEPRSVQMTQYDPGSAAYRYHSAANVAEGGRSSFIRFGHGNPHCDLRQWDGMEQRGIVQDLIREADVVHVHMDYSTLGIAEVKLDPRRQLLIRHYHGSETRTPQIVPPVIDHVVDDAMGAVHIGARLYHQRFSARCHWLPIPMPVRDYQNLRQKLFVPREDRPNQNWRIAHSPTHAPWKGTDALALAVDELSRRGLPLELVKIMGMSHGDALRVKATCDWCFDSFWLGIQGSGLEAAAMDQVVIAGDPKVKEEYERECGVCPYTYAEQFDDLFHVLPRLVEDADFRTAEAERVSRYVQEVHDYPIVGAKYWRIVAQEREAKGLL